MVKMQKNGNAKLMDAVSGVGTHHFRTVGCIARMRYSVTHPSRATLRHCHRSMNITRCSLYPLYAGSNQQQKQLSAANIWWFTKSLCACASRQIVFTCQFTLKHFLSIMNPAFRVSSARFHEQKIRFVQRPMVLASTCRSSSSFAPARSALGRLFQNVLGDYVASV